MGLGHEAEYFPAGNDGRHVVEAVLAGDGQADDDGSGQLDAFGAEVAQGLERGGAEGGVVEQIGAGVAREAELGEHGEAHAGVGQLTPFGDDGVAVKGDVGHAQLGRDGGDATKSMLF